MKAQELFKLSRTQAGVAGEYLVAAELSRRGYVASVTLRNTRGIDILASNRDATKSVGIQVKTCQGARPVWESKTGTGCFSSLSVRYLIKGGKDDGSSDSNEVASKVPRLAR